MKTSILVAAMFAATTAVAGDDDSGKFSGVGGNFGGSVSSFSKSGGVSVTGGMGGSGRSFIRNESGSGQFSGASVNWDSNVSKGGEEMTKQTDTSAEAVERLREILSYGLPSHVEIQTGEGTSSPNAVFADADFKVGDGVCGLHASGRQANEPCIPYIRADALVHALAERDRYKALIEKEQTGE